MKFQDDISNMNTYVRTYIQTYIRTSRNQYVPYFFKVGGITKRFYQGLIPPNDANGKTNTSYPDQTASIEHSDLGLHYLPKHVQNFMIMMVAIIYSMNGY